MENQELKASGWDAITLEFDRIYPNQKNPLHMGTLISWELGGNDPLRGISIYDAGDCWHFVSYGLTELYEKESEDLQWSGYGMEFTFKLKKDERQNDDDEIRGICGIFQTLARMTFTNGNIFLPYQYIYTGQEVGMDVNQQSKITGFFTIPDQEANTLETENGKVEFVQFVGATDSELKAVMNKELTVEELYKKIGTDVTDYFRSAVII